MEPLKTKKKKNLYSLILVISLSIITLLGMIRLPSVGFEEEEKRQLAISYQTKEIYNGNMKKNQIKGTTDPTIYQDAEEITVGEEEVGKSLQISENHTFAKIEKMPKVEEVPRGEVPSEKEQEQEILVDFPNEGNLVYQGIKVNKDNLIDILGEEGKIEILDKEQNILASIDKQSQWEENGNLTFNYEKEQEEIYLKTTDIQKEGILYLAHEKEIKNNIMDITNTKVKTNTAITVGEQEKTITAENILDIQESTTNIDIQVDKQEWTNEQQNEITFDITLNANSIKDNLFKNPNLKIELPNEVEKVILQNTEIFHDNGLLLQEPYIQVNEKGNIEIIANLTGEQEEYDQNELGLTTDVKLETTIILKKDIQANQAKVKLQYTNEYAQIESKVETGSKELDIQLQSYQQEAEEEQPKEQPEIYQTAQTEEGQTERQIIQGLQLEVAPVRGDVALSNQDIIYEGEYIKYNIKVTNRAQEMMNEVQIIGNIPEETIYGELEADYHNSRGEYKYQLKEEVKAKTIEIGTLEPGQSKTTFYEVRVKDLEEVQEKQMITHIQVKVGQLEAGNYQLENTVKPSDFQVFLEAQLDNAKDRWNYNISVAGKENEPFTLQVKLPEEFTPLYDKVSKDNIITYENVIIEDKEFCFSIQGIIDSTKIAKEGKNSQIELTASASVIKGDKTYQSNENRILYQYENVAIQMTSKNEGEDVKYGEEIEYKIQITNTGRTNLNDPGYEFIAIHVTDFLPENVTPVSMTYDNWMPEVIIKNQEGKEEKVILEEYEGEITSYLPTGKFRKKEAIAKDISTIVKNEKGEENPNVNLNLIIPYQESITITIKTTAGFVLEKTKVQNNASVTGISIDSKTSNTIIHTILPFSDDENQEDPDKPGEPENPDKPDKPEDPEKPNKPENPNQPQENYNISGIAWVDENKDGKRQENEAKLSKIHVFLIQLEQGKIIQETDTNANGNYQFSNLKQGDYLVAFEYDKNTYTITEYRKNGIDANSNSDVTNKKITIQGKQKQVAVTDTIKLKNSVHNIDMGLIKNKICDLKLDKYIDKIVVETKNGSKQIEYNQATLAKVEIKAKEIEGAKVTITYKIVITNEGEIPTTVGKIIDYLPAGVDFVEAKNRNWTKDKEGQLMNKSTANKIIKAGESIEVPFIASKTMTAETTGNFINQAEIGSISNAEGIADIDSIPENKNETEDDIGKAEVIISVSTGEIIFYISGIFLTLIFAMILINSKRKKIKLNKIAIFALIFTMILGYQAISSTISAKYIQKVNITGYDHLKRILEDRGIKQVNISSSILETLFNNVQNDQGWTTDDFTGGPNNVGGICTNAGYWGYSGYYDLYSIDSNPTDVGSQIPEVTVDLAKKDTEIKMKILNEDNCLLGPFEVTYSEATQFSYSVTCYDGTEVQNYYISDENGNPVAIGSKIFYLSIPKEYAEKGIAKIAMKAGKTETVTIKTKLSAYLLYQSWGTLGHESDSRYPEPSERWPNEWGTKHLPGHEGEKIDMVTFNGGIYRYATQLVRTRTSVVFMDDEEQQERSGEKTVEWEASEFPISIEVIKQDADKPEEKLANVEIRVQCQETRYDQTHITDENGKIIVDSLPGNLEYTITEIKTPYYGYFPEAHEIRNIKNGMVAIIKLNNTHHTGNLNLEKQDLNTKKPIKRSGI